MSDLMLMGVLRAPTPEPDNVLGIAQLADRARQAADEIERLEGALELVGEDKKVQRLEGAAEMLWAVLANVSGGDWTRQTEEWQVYAARWRDNYFEALDKEPNIHRGQYHHPDCGYWRWDWRYSWDATDCNCEDVAGPTDPDKEQT